MVDYLPRTAWKARAPKSGPGLLTVDRVKGAVIHWPGTTSSTPITSQAAVASQLRGWQAYHMDTKGWSDIAYQVAVDQAGRAWTLRGLRTQSGANGDTEVNEDYCAILLVLVQGEQPSAAMKATVREVIADVRRIYPNAKAILPHGAVRPEPTDCPGPAARAAITRGDFTPGTPQEDDDMPTIAEVEAAVKRVIETHDRGLYDAAVNGTEGVWNKQLQDKLDKLTATLAALDTKELGRYQRDEVLAARTIAAIQAAAVDTPALAQAIVDKLPSGSVDQATVEAGVRAVLREGTE